MDIVGFIVGLWIILYLVPLLAISGPIWFFGRRRVKWSAWDYSIVIFPFSVWLFLMFVHGKDKSLANLVEVIYLACLSSLAPISRVLIQNKVNEVILSVCLLVLLCLAAVALWAFVPSLPE